MCEDFFYNIIVSHTIKSVFTSSPSYPMLPANAVECDQICWLLSVPDCCCHVSTKSDNLAPTALVSFTVIIVITMVTSVYYHVPNRELANLVTPLSCRLLSFREYNIGKEADLYSAYCQYLDH